LVDSLDAATRLNFSDLSRRQNNMSYQQLKSDKTRQTWSGRYIVRGGTHSITLPPDLRERMGFVHGDYAIMLLIGDVLRLRRVTPGMVLKGEFWEQDKPKEPEKKT
jgi:hypothetical protein